MEIKELQKDKDYAIIITNEEKKLLSEDEEFRAGINRLAERVRTLTILSDHNELRECKAIRYKLLHKDAKPLSRGHEDDSGFDLTTAWIEPFDLPVDPKGGWQNTSYKLHMGIAVAPPEGYYFDMRPRSSFSKTGYVCGNSLGTIDKGYRGELMAIVHPVADGLPELKAGDRHFQLVLQKYENDEVVLTEVDDFPEVTQRGSGGFGSTGK